MQAARLQRHAAPFLQPLDQRGGPLEELGHDALVVFHGRALGDDERHHRGALRSEVIDDQRAVDDVHPRARLLAHGEALAHHLRGESRARLIQARQLHLAPVGADVVEDDGAEGIDEDLAAVLERHAYLAQGELGTGIEGHQLAQREVLFEGHRRELMRAHGGTLPPRESKNRGSCTSSFSCTASGSCGCP